MFPVGYPLQGIELATQSTPEVSFKRLIPLVDYLAMWKHLTNVSQWVLLTADRGYRIQLGSHLPRFYRVVPTLMGPEQALVLEQEDSLGEGGHRTCCSFLSRESRLLHCSEEGWGLRSVLDLSAESLCQETHVQNADNQTDYDSNQDRGLVYHIRSEGCIVSIFPEVAEQKVTEICFQGQSIPILGSSF